MNKIKLILAASIFLFGSVVNASSLYGIGGGSNLYSIDVDTGASSLLFPSSPLYSGTGLAFGPDGLLYGIGGGSNLYSIDVDTGASSLLFPSSPLYSGTGLAFGPDGLLYGIGGGSNLYSIDVSTGASSLLFPSSPLYSNSGLAFPPSPVPVPAAVWLFGTALIGLVGFSKRRKSAITSSA